MIKKYKKINYFDKVTSFRLINLAYITVGINLLLPIITDLRGELLSPTIISFFMILSTLAIKLNNYIVNNYTIPELYKIGIFVHIFLIINVGLYFYSPLLFIYLEGIFLIIQIAIFSSYSILLDVYQTNNFPNQVSDFKVLRNSIYADTSLIGLTIVAIITYFYNINYALIIFLIYNILFNIYLIKNWNYLNFVNEKLEIK